MEYYKQPSDKSENNNQGKVVAAGHSNYVSSSNSNAGEDIPHNNDMKQQNGSNLSIKKEVKKRGNFIVRQELKSYTPECNPRCVIIFNSILILIFCAAGVPIVMFSQSEINYHFDYTDW
jgi:hypothetical protein